MATPPKKSYFTVKYVRTKPGVTATRSVGSRSISAYTAQEAINVLAKEFGKIYPGYDIEYTA
ncbi:hypothetical protein [Pseudomonas sp. A34-9]|uniref:hypothetical protein n=1 Tax=Pseudomonas sp. A34-9 TaxID=3034675 RepID=UPI00240E6B1E|nr:hypothetical protein [Pseudomonas sp. A34-9]